MKATEIFHEHAKRVKRADCLYESINTTIEGFTVVIVTDDGKVPSSKLYHRLLVIDRELLAATDSIAPAYWCKKSVATISAALDSSLAAAGLDPKTLYGNPHYMVLKNQLETQHCAWEQVESTPETETKKFHAACEAFEKVCI